MISKTAQGTQGTLEVTVAGEHNLTFQGDADKMDMYQEPNGIWHLVATKQISPEPNRFFGIDIYLPAELPSNGTQHSYSFADGHARLLFSAHENSGISPYWATAGEITVSFNGERMQASFSGRAQFGSDKQITLTKGVVDLTGVSMVHSAQYPAKGELDLTFEGGPLSGFYSFKTDLRIDSSDFGGHRPDRRIFMGDYYDDGLPRTRNIFAIVVYNDAKGLIHDLAGNNDVRVQFQRLNTYGTVTAHAGLLTLNEEVTDEHGSGKFTCSFRKNDEPEFTATGTFTLDKARH